MTRKIYKILPVIITVLLIFTSYASAKLLVIAPHPDDEALMSAGIIYSALQRGEDVKVVVLTNGDKYGGVGSGLRREDESIKALVNVLGMQESDIIFLGYPDGGLKSIYESHQSASDAYSNDFGISATYGNRGLGGSDYHTYRFGSPAAYNKVNVLADLQSILQEYQPERIFVTAEEDPHEDHSAAHLYLIDALHGLAAVVPDYMPIIHKTVIHGGSNWPNHIDPTSHFVAPAALPASLQWDRRESITVPGVMQGLQLADNLKYACITQYESQLNDFLISFVHSDEIFWPEYIYSTNNPPVSNAGTRQTVLEGTEVTLNGNASFDPDGTPLTYQWSQLQGPPVTLSDPASPAPSFTAPLVGSVPQTLTFQLAVSDGQIVSYPNTVVITVVATLTNNPPTANAGLAQTVRAGTEVLLNGMASIDPDGNPLTYHWSQLQGVPVVLSNTASATPSFIAPLVDAGSPDLILQLVVSDGQFSSTPATVAITILPAPINSPPTANAGVAQSVREGADAALNGGASSDPDDEALTFQWSQLQGTMVVLSDPASPTPSFTAPLVGSSPQTLVFQLIVSDGQHYSTPATVQVTVEPASQTSVNVAPLASVTASSENAATAQLAQKAIDTVKDGYPGDYTKEWATVGQRAGAWIQLNWSQSYTIDKIVLYDRPNLTDLILSATLTFSDGSSMTVGPLANNGSGDTFTFPAKTVNWVKLTVNQANGQNIGLEEFEVFGNPVIDTIAPAVSVNAPAENATVSGPVAVTATAGDNVGITRVEFYIDGSLKATVTAAPYSYSWDTTLAANGSHTLYAKAFDAANNSTQSALVSVTVNNVIPDTTAPTVAITAPAANATVSGIAAVTATAGDNVGVTRVEFYIDGSLKATVTAAPYSYSWDTTLAANGSHTLYAKAFDAANNSTQSALVSVTVNNVIPDTTAPTVAISAPSNSATVSGPVAVTATAGDNVGVTRVEFYIDGGLKATVTAAPYSYSWDTTLAANGSHTLYALAYDAANNSAQSAAVSVTVNNIVPDTTAPTVAISAPSNNTTVSGTTAVTATAGDNVGVTRVEFYIDGSLKATVTAAPYSYSWDTTQVANGSHTLYALAYDAANNSAQSAVVSVTVNNVVPDTTSPTVAITTPATDTTVSGPVAVTATAGDNVGVTRVEFYIDGSLKATVTTAPYSYSWDTTAVANGNHTLYAKAYDAANNSSQSALVSVTVNNVIPDTTAPTVAISAPSNNATASNSTAVTATAGDNVGVTRVEFYIDGSLKATVTSAPYIYSWDTTLAANGSHTLYAKAFDAANNNSQSSPVSVTVANMNIAPLATVSASSEDTSTGQLAIKAIDTIKDGYPGDYTKEWATVGQRTGAWIQLNWSHSYTVSRIVLYDRPNLTDQILSATLTFSDGSSVAVGNLTNNGSGDSITFPAKTVNWVKLTVNQANGQNTGLADFEVYGISDSTTNNPPTANAGIAQTIQEGTVATLSGVASSDPDGNPLTYQWSQLQGTMVILSDPASPTPVFTAPLVGSSSQTLVFQLVVSDGQLYSTPATVQVTVFPVSQDTVNVAPLATVTASSENAATGQLAIKAVDTVKDGYPGDYTKEWATVGQRAGAWIQLNWSQSYTIDKIVLNDRPNLTDQILSATLTFSDGSSITVGNLTNNGSGDTFTFPAKTVTWAKLTVNQANGSNTGLSEFAVFGR